MRGLAAAIGDALGTAFPGEVWVRGEIHDLHRARSGHVYFTLVDGGDGDPHDDDRAGPPARLSVMLSASRRTRVNRLLLRAGGRVKMTDGTEVRIRGRLDWYAPRGQLQLRMTSIDPAFTLGQLAAARAELLDRLRAEDLLDRNAGVPMPAMPLRIGLVTSAGSAAEADVVHELESSGFGFSVLVADVRVQGAEAATPLAAAIEAMAREAIDVLVVVRGGGATSDLSVFDSEVVARAISSSPHPVVVGVGHEVDRTVADEVAHLAVKTPTAAARAVVSVVAETHERTEALGRAIVDRARALVRTTQERLDRDAARLGVAVRGAVRQERTRLDAAGERLDRASTRALARASERVDRCAERLPAAVDRTLDRHRRELDAAATRLGTLDPERLLARGWSITRDADGRVVRSVSDTERDASLHITVHHGTIRVSVDDLQDTTGDATRDETGTQP